MRKPATKRYWSFQLLGWLAYILVNISFVIAFDYLTSAFFLKTIFFFEVGLLFSHMMREVIHHLGFVSKRIDQQILILAAMTIGFALLCGIVLASFELSCKITPVRFTSLPPYLFFFIKHFAISSTLLFIWNSIYFMSHFERSKKQQDDILGLSELVKEAELRIIKGDINQQALFRSLSRIKNLIEMNPLKAREEITELSKHLRSIR